MATNQQSNQETNKAGRSALEGLQAQLAEAMHRPLERLAEPTPESLALYAAIGDFTAQVSRLGSAVQRLKAGRSDEPDK